MSRQSRATIATIVATTLVRLETSEVAVEVTVACMPPMSLATPDRTSPVRVRVQKASDMRRSWRHTAVRRSCMTRWPTVAEIEGLQDTEDAGDHRAEDHAEREQAQQTGAALGIATSRVSFSRKGVATVTRDQAPTSRPTIARRPR